MPTYRDYAMLSDGLSSLENALLNKKKLRMAEQERQDRITERSQDREDRRADIDSRERIHREAQATVEKERGDNNAFREKQLNQQGEHYKEMQAQGRERNVMLSAGQIAEQRQARKEALQASFNVLAVRVRHGMQTPEEAFMVFKPAVDSMDKEDLQGTIFAGLSPESFGRPEPVDPTATRATTSGGKAAATEPAEVDEDSWEVMLKQARGQLRRAQAMGDKAAEQKAQTTIENIETGMLKEQGSAVGVYDKNGVFTPAGGKPVGQSGPPQAGKAPLPGASESIQLPGGGEYKTTAVPWTEHPDARTLVKELASLESQLKALGTSAPSTVMRPRSTLGSGLPGAPISMESQYQASPEEKVAHDLKVKDIVRKIAEKTKALEALKASNPAK